MLYPRESGRLIAENAVHVKISDENVERVAKDVISNCAIVSLDCKLLREWRIREDGQFRE